MVGDQGFKGLGNSNIKIQEDLTVEEELIELDSGRGHLTVIKVIDDDKVAIGFSEGDVVIQNLETLEVLRSYSEHSSAITCLEVSTLVDTKGQKVDVLLSGGSQSECCLLIYDIYGGTVLGKLEGHRNLISAIRDLNDGRTVVTGSFDTSILFWDLKRHSKSVLTLDEHNAPVLALDYN